MGLGVGSPGLGAARIDRKDIASGSGHHSPAAASVSSRRSPAAGRDGTDTPMIRNSAASTTVLRAHSAIDEPALTSSYSPSLGGSEGGAPVS